MKIIGHDMPIFISRCKDKFKHMKKKNGIEGFTELNFASNSTISTITNLLLTFIMTQEISIKKIKNESNKITK